MENEFDWKSEFVLEFLPQTPKAETETESKEFQIGATETRPVYIFMFQYKVITMRYKINPDTSVDSSFWVEDINGDWIRETDGNRYIYRHRPIEIKQQLAGYIKGYLWIAQYIPVRRSN